MIYALGRVINDNARSLSRRARAVFFGDANICGPAVFTEPAVVVVAADTCVSRAVSVIKEDERRHCV